MVRTEKTFFLATLLGLLIALNSYSYNNSNTVFSREIEVTIALQASSNFTMLVFYTDSISNKFKLAKKVDYRSSNRPDTLIFNFPYSGLLENLRFDFSQQPDVITKLNYIKLESDSFSVELSPLEIQSFFYSNDYIEVISCNQFAFTFKSITNNQVIDPYIVFSEMFKDYFNKMQRFDQIGYLKLSLATKSLAYFTININSTRSSTANSLLFRTKDYLRDTLDVVIPIYGITRYFDKIHIDIGFSKSERADVSFYNLALECNDTNVTLTGDEFLSYFDYNHHLFASKTNENEIMFTFRKMNQNDESPSFSTGRRDFHSQYELILRIVLAPIILITLFIANWTYFRRKTSWQ